MSNVERLDVTLKHSGKWRNGAYTVRRKKESILVEYVILMSVQPAAIFFISRFIRHVDINYVACMGALSASKNVTC